MGVDFATIENSWLTGFTRFERWRIEDEARFFRPLLQSMVAVHAQMIRSAPPEVLAELKRQDPVGFARYEAFVAQTLGTKAEESSYGV